MQKTRWLCLTKLFVCLVHICQWKTAHSQCLGTPLTMIANSTYQEFTSPNYPANYPNNLDCTWIIQAENVTDAVRVELLDTAVEYHADCAYDKVEAFDGHNASFTSLIKFCGLSKPNIVSSGNYLTLTFTSDYSLSSRGFKAQHRSGERSSLLDEEEETDRLDFLVIGAAALGVALLVFTICAAAYACQQVKKAKRSRRITALEPQDALPAYQLEYIRPPGPPSYGDFYASPLSPPPAYTELDPNPHQVISNAGDRGRTGRDVNANTHFMRPPHLRASRGFDLSTLYPGMYVSRNTGMIATQGSLQAASRGSSDIPGQPDDIPEDEREMEHAINDTTAPSNDGANNIAQAQVNSGIPTENDGLSPPIESNQNTNREYPQTIAREDGMASAVHGPVPDSSLDRRASDVSDMSLPPSLCSDDQSISDESEPNN